MNRRKNKTDEQHPCAWTEDVDGNYDTDCGQMFCFIEGGPSENKMRFCCYCGLVLVVVPRQPDILEDDDDD